MLLMGLRMWLKLLKVILIMLWYYRIRHASIAWAFPCIIWRYYLYYYCTCFLSAFLLIFDMNVKLVQCLYSCFLSCLVFTLEVMVELLCMCFPKVVQLHDKFPAWLLPEYSYIVAPDTVSKNDLLLVKFPFSFNSSY